MVNTEGIISRLGEILDFYGLSGAAFADKINVQRSSISHLLTGRNKPSLEFVLKISKAFPEVDLYWLLEGKGDFPSNPVRPASANTVLPEMKNTSRILDKNENRNLAKIILLYDDGSFETYGEKEKKLVDPHSK